MIIVDMPLRLGAIAEIAIVECLAHSLKMRVARVRSVPHGGGQVHGGPTSTVGRRVGDLVKVAGKWVDTEDLTESHTQTAALRVADGYRGCAALPWLLRSTDHWKKVI